MTKPTPSMSGDLHLCRRIIAISEAEGSEIAPTDRREAVLPRTRLERRRGQRFLERSRDCGCQSLRVTDRYQWAETAMLKHFTRS